MTPKFVYRLLCSTDYGESPHNDYKFSDEQYLPYLASSFDFSEFLNRNANLLIDIAKFRLHLTCMAPAFAKMVPQRSLSL